jgi:hypothetical protein
MQKEMSSARVALVPTLLRSLAVGSALIATAVVPAGIAAAAEPTGTTVVGTLLQAWPETRDAAGGAEQPISWVQNADGDAFRIPTDEVEGIDPGTTLRITVDPAGDGDAQHDGNAEDPLYDVTDTTIVKSAPPAPVLRDPAGLTNQVTVVRVNPDGAARDDVPVQQLVDVVDTTVADFWSEQSNGTISVGVTRAVPDWVTPVAGCADPTAMWNEVAASVGFTPGPGKHLLLYVSHAATTCSYALGQVGSTPASGGRLYVRDTLSSVIAHELGHNFGLGHSSAQQCDGAVESATCRTSAYRDYYDVMGVSWARLGSLNAPQAARLGVLPAAQQTGLTVQSAATTVTLAPFAGRAGTRALRLTDADGVDYWLEYRTATVRDAWLATTQNRYHLQTGVLLRKAGGLPDTSLLLDGTPSAAAGWDGDLQEALPVGTAIPVSGGDFSVVVQSADADGAVLTVTPTPPAVAAAKVPRPAAHAPSGTVLPGSTDGAAPPVGTIAGYWGPSSVAPDALPSTPALSAAADSSSISRLLLPLVASVSAGATLLTVRLVRRRALRSR